MNSGPQKVLVIEDDRLLRDVYIEMLTDEGFVVDSAIDGEEGQAKILTGGWDLILLDIMLPKKDGLQILKDLNTPNNLNILKTKFPNGPIILLTALSNDNAIKEGLANGAAGYLIKSAIPLGEKIKEIREIMKQYKS